MRKRTIGKIILLAVLCGVCGLAQALSVDRYELMLSSGGASKVHSLVQKDLAFRTDRDLKRFGLMLKRVMRLERYVSSEQNPQMLMKAILSLRPFYYKYRMLDAALSNDRRLYAVLPSDEGLSRLLETLVAMGRESEALPLCERIKPDAVLPSLLLHGSLIFARAGRLVESEGLLRRVDLRRCAAPELYLWLQTAAARGDVKLGIEIVRKILVNAPPHEIKALRRQLASGEFAVFASVPEYQAALKTETQAKAGQGQCPNSGTIRCQGND